MDWDILPVVKHIAAEIILFFKEIMHIICIVRATQSNCCSKKEQFYCS